MPVSSCAAGNVGDFILDIIPIVVGNAVNLTINLKPSYRDRYLAPWINGVYMGSNIFCHAGSEEVQATYNIGSSELCSIVINDAGDWADFSNFLTPPDPPTVYEAAMSNRLFLSWQSSYSLSSVVGDTQLSNLVVSGAVRNFNLSTGTLPTRGLLSYSITTDSSGIIWLRFWQGTRMVAEGSVSGSSSFSCAPIDSSGLSVTGTLTYTNDVASGNATFEVIWPKAYYIYYSTSTLSFPSDPQYIIPDQNLPKYNYLSPTLTGSTYNCVVLTLDDQNRVQTTNIPTPIIITINNNPLPATNITYSGKADALTINWDIQDPNPCFYTVYYSLINDVVNLGQYSLPAPIITLANATSVTLRTITNYAPVDRTPYLQQLTQTVSYAIDELNYAYNIGESGWLDAINTAQDVIVNAAILFGQQCSVQVYTLLDAFIGQTSYLTGKESQLSLLNLPTSNWQTQTYLTYGQWISFVGSMLNNYALFSLPDGTHGLVSSITDNFETMVEPIILPGQLRVIVRATDIATNIQEMNDNQTLITFDIYGNTVGAQPNLARICQITPNDLIANVTVEIIDDNAEVIPDTVNFYVGAENAVFDVNYPTVNASINAPGSSNIQSLTQNLEQTSAGYYGFAVAAVANGIIGPISDTVNIYLGEAPNTSVGSLSVLVQKGGA